ncbi:YraN family protein [Pseudomonas sp. N040]|uniref:YraN family protein n=1 Tax=Pseudomonas sp. N040 TaxID=2785325 RepID=UPI0018A2C21C|nr:YraN family protein [Pseudomonas sp. N040]MBF7730339.1 YraN family protein [Pseudomonas sp. N040]MBW7013981.1 YraN family protein [Pseudomonas sp. N040]
MSSSQTRGQTAENLARQHLESHGLTLVAHNWRGRRGELDLIMLDGTTLVFVEVRMRQHLGWGGALESVDLRKRGKLILAAQQFLQSEPRWAKSPCRFDVVAIEPAQQQAALRLNWLKNAFEC